MAYHSDLYAYRTMMDQFRNPQVAMELIDTSWINNPKSATYLVLNIYLKNNLDLYIFYKLQSTKDLLISSNQLIEALNKEIEQRN